MLAGDSGGASLVSALSLHGAASRRYRGKTRVALTGELGPLPAPRQTLLPVRSAGGGASEGRWLE